MKKLVCLLLLLIVTSSMCIAEENGCTHSFIIYHAYENYCPTCDQEKEIAYWPCKVCDGEGTVKCTKCYGTGRVKCFWCDILEENGCSFCGYTGMQSCSKYDTCSQCSGTGHNSVRNMFCQTCFTTVRCKYCGEAEHDADAVFAEFCPLCTPEAYPEFQYNSVMRKAERPLGERFSFTGTITDIEEITYWELPQSEGDIDFGIHAGINRVYRFTIKRTENERDYNYTTYCIRHADEDRFLTGDNVDVYGTLSYVDAQTMPVFMAATIQLQ